MYGGIYNYTQHPQTTRDFPIYTTIGLQDLIRRFGDNYIEYQKKTGVLLPKIKK